MTGHPTPPDRVSPLSLWYCESASQWVEALPVGNGRLGAMVFGGFPEERLQFNEDTVWTGQPHDYAHPGAAEHFPALRESWLDLDRAIAGTSYCCGGVRFTRQVFCSHPDQAIVVQLAADRPGALAFTVRLETPHAAAQVRIIAKDQLLLSGQVEPNGIRFAARLAAASGVAGHHCRPAGHVDDARPLTEYDPAHPYIVAMYDLEEAG